MITTLKFTAAAVSAYALHEKASQLCKFKESSGETRASMEQRLVGRGEKTRRGRSDKQAANITC